jgi:hypothetical protein
MGFDLKDVAELDNLRLALRFVRQDKEDEVIRDPLKDVAFLETGGSKLQNLSRQLVDGDYDPEPSLIVETGKSNHTSRPLSHITLYDWIVAQAILNHAAPVLDAEIPLSSLPCVSTLTGSNDLLANSSDTGTAIGHHSDVVSGAVLKPYLASSLLTLAVFLNTWTYVSYWK